MAVAALLLGGTTANAGAATTGAATNGAEEPLPVSVGFSPERMDVRAGEFHELFPYLEVPGSEPEPDPETGAVPPVHDGPYTLTFDATGLDGVASVDLPCGDGPVTTCVYDRMYWPDFPIDILTLKVDPEAAPGATGVLTVTGEGEGLAFTSRPLTVRVVAPEYQERVLAEPEGFRAGDVLSAPLGFRTGNGLAGHGAVLRVSGTRGLALARDHENCWYAEKTDGPLPGQGSDAVCVLPQYFEAGVGYELAEPFEVAARDFALDDTLAYSFEEGGAGRAQELMAGREFRQGAGAPLTVRRAAAQPSGGYADDVTLTLPSTGAYDLELTGDRARVVAGRTATVEVGFGNAGPAWYSGLADGDDGGEPLSLVLEAPEGATVTAAPEGCAADGAGAYRCVLGAVAEDDHRTYAFTLRVDRKVHGATAAVTLTGDLSHDADHADDTAAVVLNPVGRR
ncbi:hypothetical protein ABT026_01230 [Streptomyces sp. NPDC002734]|uniref:hypothetical protein n=1 Tax=Streptomyces sp. NPDC002734 TaxID=3154426 RepID=UPI00331732FC